MLSFLPVRVCRIALSVACGMLAVAASAADLKVGFKFEVTAADPHVLNGANRNVWAHVYETLAVQDEALRTKPLLATSWRNIDPATWEFKLRPNVIFHNGAPLTADDVKFSLERASTLAGPRTFRAYLNAIESISVPAPLTVVIKTKGPSPALLDNLSLVPIISKTAGDKLSEENFGNGKAAIGTGPYKFSSWAHGQRIVLARNAAYWGDKEPWDTVTFQFLPRDAARASALLANTVDVIDGATASVADSFKSSNRIDMAAVTSYMLNYLGIDRFRANSPFIKSNQGAPLGKNPFNDLKVRQALNLAVNRDGIIKQLMKGDAESAGQLVPPGFFGNDPGLKPAPQDLAKAKALMAEAGYADGFKLTLHCSNDRYLNDGKVCEALGQVFSQLGIKTEVATMPFAVFQPRAVAGAAGESEFSMYLMGIGATTGDSLQSLLAVARTRDKEAGLGSNNYGRYSNKEVDSIIDKAAKTMNEKAREDLQKTAVKMVADDVGIIPLYYLKASWAYRKGLTLKPRSDGFTLAMNIRAAGAK